MQNWSGTAITVFKVAAVRPASNTGLTPHFMPLMVSIALLRSAWLVALRKVCKTESASKRRPLKTVTMPLGLVSVVLGAGGDCVPTFLGAG